VVGLPDPARGELACAVVVPLGSEQEVSLDSVAGHLREQGMAPAQWPERLEIVADFPRTWPECRWPPDQWWEKTWWGDSHGPVR
jgi:non-ribosomal peptide synthetase component E (peptide arylation enzyme)